jgi:adenylate kinase family enzyme
VRNILLFGNSASGKSTLATRLAQELQVAHLDLDSLAWRPTQPPRRRPLEETTIAINEFTGNNAFWIVEGCYTDLLEVLEQRAGELIFLM